MKYVKEVLEIATVRPPMASQTPRFSIAKPARSNGVLSIPASATHKRAPTTSDNSGSRVVSRLKIVIRRLPPGLTQVEFEEVLGDDWKVKGENVDWAVYKPGKVSKE